MRNLKTFLLGAVAIGVLAYALAAALAMSAQAGGRALHVGVGPFLLVSVTHEETAAVTTFGLGLAVLAVAGGLVNLAAAHLLRRRGHAGRLTHRVD